MYQMLCKMTKAWINTTVLAASAWLAAASLAQDSGTMGAVTKLRIPRFLSLKASTVNARVGPGSDYQIAWVFRRAGLPVEVLSEFETWRQVRDSEGGTGWVSANLVSARRTAQVMPWSKDRTLVQLTSSRGGSAPVAQIEAGAIVDIAYCDGNFCRVYAGTEEGWISQKSLWGVYPAEIVR